MINLSPPATARPDHPGTPKHVEDDHCILNRRYALHVMVNARAYPRDLVKRCWQFLRGIEQ